MPALHLNVDLGELPDEDPELYALATDVNIACGGHAGDQTSMRHALSNAKRHANAVFAHPSYPDRANFGRRSPEVIDVGAALRSIDVQLSALDALARDAGVHLAGLKPHGALYHDAASQPELADGIAKALATIAPSATLVGPPDSSLARAAARFALTFFAEGFADRTYEPDGKLRSRSLPGAMIDDVEAAAQQAISLAESGRFQTLCVHGDGQHAVAIARAVRAALVSKGLLR